MVDAQAVQHALAQQLEDQPMRVLEQLRQLHAQAGQLVDVEEAAVVDVVGGDAEMRRRASAGPGSARRARCQLASCPGSPLSRPTAASIAAAHLHAVAGQLGQLAPAGPWRAARPAAASPAGWRRHRRAAPAPDASSPSTRCVVQRADRQLVRAVGPDREAARVRRRTAAPGRPPPAPRRTGRPGTAPAASRADSAGPGPSRCRTSRRRRESGPHSSTSSHSGLSAPPTPMWFGHEIEDLAEAVRPQRRHHAPERPASSPSSGLSWPWSTMS